MRGKVIEVVKFILILFLFFVCSLEGSKVKLVKVKEFSSYDEYERWRGIKPRRVRVEGDFVKFYDDKGKLIKEIKLGNEYEVEKIFCDDRGVLLLELEKEGEPEDAPAVYHIYDGSGNFKASIVTEDFYEYLYSAPNGSYFISVRPDEGGDVDNFWRVYGDDGKILYDGKFLDDKPEGALFDFEGIFFSDDSRYCLICVERGKDGFVVYDSSKNAIVWRVFRDWDILEKGIAFLRSGRGIIIPTQEGVYRFSVDGKQIWYNKETELWFTFFTVNCESPDGRDIAYYDCDIIYILDLTNGNLIRSLELPNNEIRYTDEKSVLITNKVKYLFLKEGGWKVDRRTPGAKKIKVMYLIDKRDGGIIWSRENVEEGLVDAELISEDEFLVKEAGKWCLYKITEE